MMEDRDLSRYDYITFMEKMMDSGEEDVDESTDRGITGNGR